ncbi:hypothetical protein BC830DRAFT_302466 [Chytriomyces sp. MP71]|nr:hypothetical protein BC830DRAFT_302466 [Chytriomyces sp. MP71]
MGFTFSRSFFSLFHGFLVCLAVVSCLGVGPRFPHALYFLHFDLVKYLWWDESSLDLSESSESERMTVSKPGKPRQPTPMSVRLAQASTRAQDLLTRARMNASSVVDMDPLAEGKGPGRSQDHAGADGFAEVSADGFVGGDRVGGMVVGGEAVAGEGDGEGRDRPTDIETLQDTVEAEYDTMEHNDGIERNLLASLASIASFASAPPLPDTNPPHPHAHPSLHPPFQQLEISQPPILASTISRFRSSLLHRALFPASRPHMAPLSDDASPQQPAIPVQPHSGNASDSSTHTESQPQYQHELQSSPPDAQVTHRKHLRTIYKDSATSPIVNNIMDASHHVVSNSTIDQVPILSQDASQAAGTQQQQQQQAGTAPSKTSHLPIQTNNPIQQLPNQGEPQSDLSDMAAAANRNEMPGTSASTAKPPIHDLKHVSPHVLFLFPSMRRMPPTPAETTTSKWMPFKICKPEWSTSIPNSCNISDDWLPSKKTQCIAV